MTAVFRTSAAGGGTSSTGDRSTSFTPAVGDHVVVICAASGNTNTSPTCSDDNGGSYDLIGTALFGASANTLSAFVRTTAMPNTTSTTVTVATGSNTAAEIGIIASSGMNYFGAASILHAAFQANQASGTTPAPALTGAASTSNPTIGAVGNSTNPATLTAPTNWTERQDVGQATPNTGLEIVTRDSGFTGTTVTWGGTSPSAFASLIMELDGRVPIDLASSAVVSPSSSVALSTAINLAAIAKGLASQASALKTVTVTTLPLYGLMGGPLMATAIEGGAFARGAALASAASAKASQTSALTTSINLASAASAKASQTSALTTSINLASAASATASQTSALVASNPLTPAAALANVSSTASLTTAISLASAAIAKASGAAALTTTTSLAAQAIASAKASSAMTSGIRLAAVGKAQVSMAADLTTASRVASERMLLVFG